MSDDWEFKSYEGKSRLQAVATCVSPVDCHSLDTHTLLEFPLIYHHDTLVPAFVWKNSLAFGWPFIATLTNAKHYNSIKEELARTLQQYKDEQLYGGCRTSGSKSAGRAYIHLPFRKLKFVKKIYICPNAEIPYILL